MSKWKNDVPRWEGSIVEPPESKKTQGYMVGDRPPAAWENWFRNSIGKSVSENRVELEKVDVIEERVTSVDARVDNIVTTSDGSINVEEIVDARHGKASLGANIQELKDDVYDHLDSAMPHKFSDLKDDKRYMIGFQVSEDGQPQIIYKEVI